MNRSALTDWHNLPIPSRRKASGTPTSVDRSGITERIEKMALEFARQREDRQVRTELAAVDFDGLRDAGFTLLAVPESMGGLWTDIPTSVRPICDLLRTLGQGDATVGLVSAMHPAVLSYWLCCQDEEEVGHEEMSEQKKRIFEGVKTGDWWGTITSEPGSGGDILQTRATAVPTDNREVYELTGQKHFGSGSGVLRYMVTTAVPAGEHEPDWFFMDTKDVPWDGSQGMTLVAKWNGHGMKATQSHSMSFERFPAHRIAWRGNIKTVAGRCGGFIGCLFTSVVVGIVDAALHTARQRLTRNSMGAFEQVEFARAEMEGWLVEQALEGMIRAVETEKDPRRAVLQGKTAIAELSEALLGRLCKIMGGGTYSRHSPFGHWFEDVRALGFLRPPWSLAIQGLIDGLPLRGVEIA